jgi:BspA type Leucine rich repeat region (6 copies)/Kelch motif
MINGRQAFTATVLLNGKVLVAGGANYGPWYSAAEIYDPLMGTWSATASMNTVRSLQTASLLSNGTVLMAGGETDNGTQNTIASAEIYSGPNTLPLSPVSYSTNGSTLTLNSYTLGGSAVIPSSTNGLPVTSIGDGAFQNNTNLTSVIIPAGVTNIGNSAFAGCTGLTNLVIPAGVTSIGQNVFSGCSNLTTITLPNSLVSIGQNAFSDCPNLTTVKASSDLLRYLDENQSALGVSQQAVSGFTPPVPGAYLPNLITNLLSSGSFLSGVAGSSSFLTPFTSQILAGSNNYGLATKTDVAALASQMSVLSNTLSTSIANQATGLSNALTASVSNALATVNGLSNTLMASEASLASNPSFVASLATNPAFLNALAAQIVASPNNLGLAVKLPQTLTLSPIAAITYSSKKVATVALKATSSVNLTNTTYIVSNPSVGIINNANLIILGKGTATITATNSGNGIYAPASATQTLIVK